MEDEIVLIGFSRAAFTVRCVATFIHDIGVLTKRGLGFLPELFELWKRRDETQDELGENARKLRDELAEKGELRRGISIEACAVWDTVEALGPRMLAGIPQPTPRRISFINSELCPNIKLAIQALALNEKRRHFKPVLWENPSDQQKLSQCWFLGTHSDVGGGNADMGLANIALAWMIAQLRSVIEFDPETICDITTETVIPSSIKVSAKSGQRSSFQFLVSMPLDQIKKRVGRYNP